MVRFAKEIIFNFILFAIEMLVLNVFLAKKGLGPLGVKVCKAIVIPLFASYI